MAELEKVQVMENILDENDRIAADTAEKLQASGVFCVNVMGAPGVGKTSVMKRLIAGCETPCFVIEGDIESDIDTEELRRLGIPTIQINTHGACHLDAPSIAGAAPELSGMKDGILFIENIGNLVCPAEFNIGEHMKLLIVSAADGSDKPYKYPLAFEKADLILINKCDLMQYVDFDYDYFLAGVLRQNKDAKVFQVSARVGTGFEEVVKWLSEKARV